MHRSRRRFLQGLAGSSTGALGLGVYAWRIEPHWLEIVERDLVIAHLPPELEGKTLAQLSDLHVGRRVDDAYLSAAFRRVQGLQPDLVVVTGDFTSYYQGVEARLRRVLEGIPRGRLGTFGVLGNHDYGDGWRHVDVADRIAGIAGEAGIRILSNESTEVGGLRLVGVDDFWGPRFDPKRALASLRPSQPTLTLCHNPDGVDQPGWDGFQGWILAGHTHGGQCRAPFLPPPLLPVANRRYTAGEFDLHDGRRLYISRGVGHLFRVRFLVRPEVTLFRLRRAPAAA